ncbi:MAG: AAA family ATPase, partial [Actinobacteria bacterium]|nr:AAA family ATPase [Actinomycetota bacterium]
MDLFDQSPENLTGTPLADRMRPRTLDEFEGQEKIVGPGEPLRIAIEEDNISSIIFWGPPGSGKTTLARIIANASESEFVRFSAVTAGVPDLRRIIAEAKDKRKFNNVKTTLFVDEIHRFNKAQQDTILPFVEDGTVILIGATTENPSFEVTSPLLSRSRVLPLKPLSGEEIQVLALRALKDKLQGIGGLNVEISSEAMSHLIAMSNNDARIALNTLETAS